MVCPGSIANTLTKCQRPTNRGTARQRVMRSALATGCGLTRLHLRPGTTGELDGDEFGFVAILSFRGDLEAEAAPLADPMSLYPRNNCLRKFLTVRTN